MIIYTDNKTIEYSMTKGGSFLKTISFDHDGSRKKIIHSTKDAGVFVGLMIYDEAEEFVKRKMQMMKMINFWEMPNVDSPKGRFGSFNLEHYKKVRKAIMERPQRKESITPGVRNLLRKIIRTMNILGPKAKCHTTFMCDDGMQNNDVFVKTPMQLTTEQCAKLGQELGKTDIIAKSDTLYIKINH